MNTHNPVRDTLYEHYPVYYKPFWATKPFIISATFIALIIIIYLVRRIMRAMQGNKVLKSWDIAQGQLKDLEHYVQEGKITSQEFYMRLTGIIKIYLHARYSYVLFDKTDEEIAEFLKKSEIAEQANTLIDKIFGQASLLKFSKQTDKPESMLNAINYVRDFVNLTTIQESTPKVK